MSIHSARRVALCALSTLFVCWTTSNLRGDEVPEVVHVEEDWEVLIGAPDPDNFSPQISNVMSPSGDVTGLHAVLELNHQSQPAFYGGGLQLQMWTGDRAISFSNSRSVATLGKPSESLTYTLSMSVSESVLKIEVLNGTSQTWGVFGGESRLKLERATTLKTLAGYSHAVSAKRSSISFGGNRVRKMLLKEVRYYAGNGKLITRRVVDLIVHQTPD
ncbi:MAG: hypothetical protein O3A00_10135 [Planctomycetota bacterium]|nr:hypothetical protein [Planctomycetota bacterium]